MSYPQEWALQDKINAAVKDCAKSYEVHAISSHVDRLEHSLRETRALVDGLRDELMASQERVMNLIDTVAGLTEIVQRLSPSGAEK